MKPGRLGHASGGRLIPSMTNALLDNGLPNPHDQGSRFVWSAHPDQQPWLTSEQTGAPSSDQSGIPRPINVDLLDELIAKQTSTPPRRLGRIY